MKKKHISITCFLLASLWSMAFGSSEKEKPNIILILTDDQGFDDYGFVQQAMETPNIDKIATEGIRFDRFYTAPACAPTRSALMTGRNYMRTGTSAVGFGAEAPHRDEYLLGQGMQAAGYSTAMVGKWNLGLSDGDLPSRRGFDEAWPIVRQDVRSYGRYEHTNAPFFHNGLYQGREKGWQVERVTDKALGFIEGHHQKPFFLYLAYSQPHEPWLCPKALQNKYIERGVGPEYAMFLGMMEQLDQQVGRILTSLQQNKLSDDTIVVFLGDNGPTPTTRILKINEDGSSSLTKDYYTMTQSEWRLRNPSGLRDKKASGWENAIRNRLSFYCPARYEPKVIDDMAIVTDVYPTLVALAGGKRRPDLPKLDGESLIPLMDGLPSTKPRVYFTAESGKPEQKEDGNGWRVRFSDESWPMDRRSSSLTLGHWSLVNDEGNWGLFDLSQDPAQKKNLKDQRPERFAHMQSLYHKEKTAIWNDPHAFSEPVQVIGYDTPQDAYLEMEGICRMKGKNHVTWANTFFHEIGAIQEMKIKALKESSYRVTLRALNVPAATRVALYVGDQWLEADLTEGSKYHKIGTLDLATGDHTLGVKVMASRDAKALKKMAMFSLHLKELKN